MHYQEVLDFWFVPEHQPHWFAKNDAFDQLIEKKFKSLQQKAAQSELWNWRKTAEGRLAEIIVLDQFSRNLFREDPRAFSQDPLALALAQEAITLNLDQQLSPEQRTFLYLPFMHSESSDIHKFAVKLFERLGNPVNLEFEHKHKVIIDRFGRYPHRNAILQRQSTAEELAFLQQPNSSF